MSSKASSIMKHAQIQKTKETIKKLIEWYALKEEYFKKYVPIQQYIIKKLIEASELSFSRLKDMAQIVLEEKQTYAHIYQKNQKSSLSNQATFLPTKEVKADPKDSKKQSKILTQGPIWSNNVDRILIAMCQGQKDRQHKIKKYLKTLDGIQEELHKQEARYKGQVKKSQKQLNKLFQKMDFKQKDASKNMAKLLKQIQKQDCKDAAFFIGELKKLEADVHEQFQYFAERNKQILRLLTLIMKNEKVIAKQIKEQLTVFLSFKKQNLNKQGPSDQKLWGLLSLIEDKVQQQRAKYFNTVLLRTDKIQMIKQLVKSVEPFKSNYHTIVKFLELDKKALMKKIKAQEQFVGLFKTISYRYWGNLCLAQGWLIESYIPAVLYMSYDYNMLIYGNDGALLKKIQTAASRVNKIEQQTVYLEQVIKGFFSDNKEEYKLKFQDIDQMEEFQLFVDNQIR